MKFASDCRGDCVAHLRGRGLAAEIAGEVFGFRDDLVHGLIDQLRGLLRAPAVIIGTWRSARPEIDGLTEAEVRDALEGLDPLWDELFPAEQARILHLLVERVDVGTDGIAIRLRTAGLACVVADLRVVRPEMREVA